MRAKALHVFGKPWIGAPTGVRPAPDRISYNKDQWNNPYVQDPYEFVDHPYPITKRALLRKKLREGSMNEESARKGLNGLSVMR